MLVDPHSHKSQYWSIIRVRKEGMVRREAHEIHEKVVNSEQIYNGQYTWNTYRKNSKIFKLI